MESSKILTLQRQLYDLQAKITVCVYVLTPGNVFEEDDIHGLTCILCDVIDELEDLSETLTGERKPTDIKLLPTLNEISKLVQFPGNGGGKHQETRQPEPEVA